MHDDDDDAMGDDTGDGYDDKRGDGSDENADVCGYPLPQQGQPQRFLPTPSGIKITDWRLWRLFS